MTDDERALLLTVARALRLYLRDTDLADDLNDALKPFDPLPEHGGDGEPAGQ